MLHRGTSWHAAVTATVAQPGQPLDAGLRAEFGHRLGRDLGGVRVHSDAAAARSAAAIGAAAYTAGNAIVFGDGRYRPSHPQGRGLIAHELTHVVQQGGHDAPADAALSVDPSPTAEAAAGATPALASVGGAAHPGASPAAAAPAQAGGGVVQRQTPDDKQKPHPVPKQPDAQIPAPPAPPVSAAPPATAPKPTPKPVPSTAPAPPAATVSGPKPAPSTAQPPPAPTAQSPQQAPAPAGPRSADTTPPGTALPPSPFAPDVSRMWKGLGDTPVIPRVPPPWTYRPPEGPPGPQVDPRLWKLPPKPEQQNPLLELLPEKLRKLVPKQREDKPEWEPAPLPGFESRPGQHNLPMVPLPGVHPGG